MCVCGGEEGVLSRMYVGNQSHPSVSEGREDGVTLHSDLNMKRSIGTQLVS